MIPCLLIMIPSVNLGALSKKLTYYQSLKSKTMNTVNANSVFGVMNMLNTEKSYIQFNRTLWILRAIMMNALEREYPDGSYEVDDESEDYWIYELTNNLIAASWIKGYDFFMKEYEIECYATQPRKGNSFITYKEAQYIVAELMSGDMLSYLGRLRDLTSFAEDRFNDKVFYVYTLADTLLHVITGETRMLN